VFNNENIYIVINTFLAIVYILFCKIILFKFYHQYVKRHKFKVYMKYTYEMRYTYDYMYECMLKVHICFLSLDSKIPSTQETPLPKNKVDLTQNVCISHINSKFMSFYVLMVKFKQNDFTE